MSGAGGPLDELVEALRSKLAARRRDLDGRLSRLEAAVAQYRRAAEQELATEFANEHRLKPPAAIGATLGRAVEELAEAVSALPDVARALARAGADGASGGGAPLVAEPTKETKAPKLVKGATPARPAPSGPLAALRAALGPRKLVVIGAISGREKADSLPSEIAQHTEFVDTARDGAHAVGNLPQRIRQGRVAALIVLDRAVKHTHSEPCVAAARDAKVPHAFAGQGGKVSLARALENLDEALRHR